MLFWSPYEAAAWTIIGQRIRTRQAAAVKQYMAEQLGEQIGLLLRIDLEERGHKKSGNR